MAKKGLDILVNEFAVAHEHGDVDVISTLANTACIGLGIKARDPFNRVAMAQFFPHVPDRQKCNPPKDLETLLRDYANKGINDMLRAIDCGSQTPIEIAITGGMGADKTGKDLALWTYILRQAVHDKIASIQAEKKIVLDVSWKPGGFWKSRDISVDARTGKFSLRLPWSDGDIEYEKELQDEDGNFSTPVHRARTKKIRAQQELPTGPRLALHPLSSFPERESV